MNKFLTIALFITGLLIGVFITTHFRTPGALGSLFPSDVMEARKNLIKDYIDEQSLYQAQIASLHKDIEETQKQNENILSKARLANLDNLKKKIGLTEMQAEGIEIILKDSSNVSRETVSPSDKNLVRASDLRDVVNLLWANRAEAIAINGQRVIAATPISAAGSSILVNNIYIVPPITITAIVNSNLIEARINDKNVLWDLKTRIAKKEILFALTAKNTVMIPIYAGDFRLKYITAKANE
ncbi:DUF881 domain-containing protein [Candidatus Peregrinibacteria bacterium]|nr:DUF881 domain-containing protein [Candidatus Peregrinibacteria bacterium]